MIDLNTPEELYEQNRKEIINSGIDDYLIPNQIETLIDVFNSSNIAVTISPIEFDCVSIRALNLTIRISDTRYCSNKFVTIDSNYKTIHKTNNFGFLINNLKRLLK